MTSRAMANRMISERFNSVDNLKSITISEWKEIEESIKSGKRYCVACNLWREIENDQAQMCNQCIDKEREELEREELERETRKKILTFECGDCGSPFALRVYAASEVIRSYGRIPDCAMYYSGRYIAPRSPGELLKIASVVIGDCGQYQEQQIKHMIWELFSYDSGYLVFICESCMRSRADRRKSTAAERQRVATQNTRARAAGLIADLSIEEWIAILDEHNYKCAYCGGPFECMEHKIPVAAGGGTTKGNVIPSCNQCNTAAYQRFRQIATLTAALQ